MSIIPRSKFGDCSICNKKSTNCVKSARQMICLNCNNAIKAKRMIDKVNNKNERREVNNNEVDKDSLISDLDTVFSRYIRIRESDQNGNAVCYTCDIKMHWTKLQAGHFIKRGNMGLRWDTRNAKPQCFKCNCDMHGNMDEYEQRLDSEFPGLVELLREEGNDVYKWTREDMKSTLISLRAKLKMAEIRLKEQ